LEQRITKARDIMLTYKDQFDTKKQSCSRKFIKTEGQEGVNGAEARGFSWLFMC